VPFLIDWGETAHPSTTSARGCRLVSLRAEHPEPGVISRMLAALGEELGVSVGVAPLMIAMIETQNGMIELH